jgi:DNA polymerase III delta prime subunit
MESEWTELFRPSKFKDLILDESIRKTFQSYIDKKSIPNMTLYGIPGIGKTTLAKIFLKELECESYLFINASDKNTVDTVKFEIKEFCDSVGFGNGDKVVVLDEADRYRTDASADVLRNIIESCINDTRFILTCNHISRITPAITSRCIPVNLKFSIQDVLRRMIEILKIQKIEFSKDDLSIIANNIVKRYFPDIRRMIKHIEFCSISGKFIYNEVNSLAELDSIITFILENKNDPKKCREYWIKNEGQFAGDYLALGSALFNKIEDPKVLLKLSERLYQLNIVLDKEIAFFAMFLEVL